jgi:formylglycine-generating enzyme required for sulfatase activity
MRLSIILVAIACPAAFIFGSCDLAVRAAPASGRGNDRNVSAPLGRADDAAGIAASRSSGCRGAAFLPSRPPAALSETEECALKPGDVFKECTDCPAMVVVPAGSFIMGSPEGEIERGRDEGPQHRVAFARPLAVGKFAVTFAEWDACAAAGGCDGYRPGDMAWGRGRLPVVNVSWDDAMAYVAWLSGRTGKSYRLLSEAEREYVTRAGTTTPFWWGTAITSQEANYNGHFSYADGPKGEYHGRVLPVDSFQPNPWGLYQVHGNVSEWAQDCFHSDYAGAPTDGSAWTSGDCSRRVIRGGSWGYEPGTLRAAYRYGEDVDARVIFGGFRVARTLAR